MVRSPGAHLWTSRQLRTVPKGLLTSSSFSSSGDPDIDIPAPGSQSRGTTASVRTIGSGRREGTVSGEGLLPRGGQSALPFRWHGMPVRENANAAPKQRPLVLPKVLIDSKGALGAIGSLGSTSKRSRGGSGGLGPY